MGILKLLGLDSEKQTASGSDELTHINQEMYKKSVEISEKNKTLSLLQKIDEIILGNITHVNEIAQKATSLLVTDIDFQSATIFLADKESAVLKRIALSSSTQSEQSETNDQPLPYLLEIGLKETNNLVIQAIIEKEVKISSTVEGVLLPRDTKAEDTHALLVVKSVFIYPLIVRGEVIGAMVICLKESIEELSEYRRDLLNRLAEIIGIAIDSAILYEEVQKSNERLKVMDKLKDEFVSLTSHELRTPMTAVKSYVALALDPRAGTLNEQQQEYLNRATMSVERLIKMVNEMLNISRIESGRLKIEMASVDSMTLAKEVREEIVPRANELGIMIVNTPATDIPPVLADMDKIKEVLINLIGNSLKFTPKGGSVTVSFTNKGDTVETSVSDSGSGIAPEDIPKLFHKFNILSGSYAPDQEVMGTGLGLYICKAIVELHSGKIWAVSEGKGKGTTFTYSLPVFTEAALTAFNEGQKQRVISGNPVDIIPTQVEK